jgi:hypothetical protein
MIFLSVLHQESYKSVGWLQTGKVQNYAVNILLLAGGMALIWYASRKRIMK